MVCHEALHIYQAFGLVIGSEFEIAGLPEADGPPGNQIADLTIRLGSVPETLVNDNSNVEGRSGSEFNWSAKHDEFLLHVNCVASYHAATGTSILVQPAMGADPHAIATFLLGSCMAAILQQRQRLVLHASCFELGGVGYAICGRSGAGKSTTTALMVQQGARLISDDVSAIDLADVPTVLPGYPRSKLSAASLRALNLEPGEMRIASAQKHKYVRPVDHLFYGQPAQLGAIFFLALSNSEGNSHEARLAPVPARSAVSLLRKNIYRRQYISDEIYPAIFAQLGPLVENVPIFTLHRPPEQDSFTEVQSLIDDQIAKLATTE